MADDIYICSESAVIPIDGVPTPIHKDVTRVREGHWLLDKYPELFKKLGVHYDVEQATAHPGERRGEPPKAEARTEPPAPQDEPKPSRKPGRRPPAKKSASGLVTG